jgi:hypothetical protein
MTANQRGVSFGRLAGGAIVGIAAATVASARIGFRRRITREIDALLAKADAVVEPGLVTEGDLEGLPEPVQRWLRWSRVVGTPRPVIVRLKQDGQFRLGEDRGWLPFAAEQYFTSDPPAFLWWVRMRMVPLVSVAGRDRYVDGLGDMDLRLGSLVPVARKRGGGLNQGDLLRFLTEALCWFPAGALSRHVSWAPVDATTARATMTYGGEQGTAEFSFDQQGRLHKLTANRYNDARGRLEQWTIPIRAYGKLGGIRVATEGDGTWNYQSGDLTYIHWRITDLDYNQPARYETLPSNAGLVGSEGSSGAMERPLGGDSPTSGSSKEPTVGGF